MLEESSASYLYDQLYEGKLVIQEQINRQRNLIEEYDKKDTNSLQHPNSKASEISLKKEDIDWYERETKVLEQLKRQLNSLRLRGGIFDVKIHQHSYLLEITGTGRIILTEIDTNPAKGDSTRSISFFEKLHKSRLPPEKQHGKPPNVFYIDNLVKIKPVTSHLPNFRPSAPERSIKAEFKHGSFTFSVIDPTELLEIFGSHLTRYNHRKVQQILRLIELNELKLTPFDPLCYYHEQLLRRLWSRCFPDKQLDSRISSMWKSLGFQNKDPAADFRGMGLLALQNLLYLAENRPHLVRKILEGNRAYPFAAVGINVTQMLCDSLNINEENIKRPPSDPEWNSLMMTFFSYVNHEYCFEEMYCFVFQLLDHKFLSLEAGFLDSPMVFDKIQEQIKHVMEQKPTSFEELYALAEEVI